MSLMAKVTAYREAKTRYDAANEVFERANVNLIDAYKDAEQAAEELLAAAQDLDA